mgnify:CR=1 FL=1
MEYWMCECGKKVSANSTVCPYCRTDKPGVATKIQSVSDGARVVVTDFDMPFLSMVGFIMKWALASIPALIGLFVLFAVFGAAIKALLPL